MYANSEILYRWYIRTERRWFVSLILQVRCWWRRARHGFSAFVSFEDLVARICIWVGTKCMHVTHTHTRMLNRKYISWPQRGNSAFSANARSRPDLARRWPHTALQLAPKRSPRGAHHHRIASHQPRENFVAYKTASEIQSSISTMQYVNGLNKYPVQCTFTLAHLSESGPEGRDRVVRNAAMHNKSKPINQRRCTEWWKHRRFVRNRESVLEMAKLRRLFVGVGYLWLM